MKVLKSLCDFDLNLACNKSPGFLVWQLRCVLQFSSHGNILFKGSNRNRKGLTSPGWRKDFYNVILHQHGSHQRSIVNTPDTKQWSHALIAFLPLCCNYSFLLENVRVWGWLKKSISLPLPSPSLQNPLSVGSGPAKRQLFPITMQSHSALKRSTETVQREEGRGEVVMRRREYIEAPSVLNEYQRGWTCDLHLALDQVI